MVDENNPITPELEKQIQDYGDSLLNPGQIWSSDNLVKEVFKYLDKYGHSGTITDKLSTRFAQIWAVYYHSHRFLDADKCWDLPLNLYAEWEKTHNNKRVARGTPYYFRGMSAVAYGNVDRGFLFFHQAVEDDFKEGFRPYKKGEGNHSPAWLFVTFGYSDPRQAGGQLLKRRADWLGQIISKYQNSNRGALSWESLSSSLSLESLGEKVLDETQLMETTFSFTYNVFRSESLQSYPKEFRSGMFASQLALDILFSLCRIGEVWLKEKQTPANYHERQLGGQLVRFCNEHAIPLNETQLSEASKADFDKCLRSLLDSKLAESDLLLIHILRNEAGHAPTSSLVVSERFGELVERIFFGLFKIVETL